MDTENLELSKVKCTRFYVEMVDQSKNEDQTRLYDEENEKENNYARSSKYLTREALPRLDNYRHIMSIQAAYRPTLEDLHNPVSISKLHGITDELEETHTKNTYLINSECAVEFGWMEGVLIPNLLSICGAILFLRFTWIVTLVGFVESIVLVSFGGVLSIITALSVCAIGTNGFIKEGGTYAMMSRSLGPEFGIPIGIVLLVGNIGLCSMYVLGLVEYIVDTTGCCIFDCDVSDTRYFSMLVFVLVTLVVAFSFVFSRCLFICVKIRNLFFAFIAIAFIYFITSFSLRTSTPEVVPFNVSVLESNLFSKYSVRHNTEYNLFFSYFAIFYPAFAEFLGGVNASGRLKDPLRTIPRGTILSIVIGVVVYIATAVVISGTVLQTTGLSASANVSNLIVSCSSYVCQQRRMNLYDIVERSIVGKEVINVATILATLYCIFVNCKTAVVSFKILSSDQLYPKLCRFNYRFMTNLQVYTLITVVGFIFLLAGKMNTLAPIVSILLLAAYAVINFGTFHISLIQPIGWRPTFKVYQPSNLHFQLLVLMFCLQKVIILALKESRLKTIEFHFLRSYLKCNMWVSLFGSILCLLIMFLISWAAALLTVLFVLGIYLFITYQKPDVNWGSSTQAQTYNNALLSVHALNTVADHVKNYRPQILVLSGLPSHRPPLVTFARLITKHLSLLICGNVHTSHVPQNEQNEYTAKARSWLKFHRIKAFYAQVDDISFEDGAKSLMQATGLGKLRPNVLLMGYKSNWMNCSQKDLDMYFNIIHKALDSHIAVCILRVKTGLDFSHLKVNQEQISENVPSVKYEFNHVNRRLNDDDTDATNKKDADGANKRKNGDLNFSEFNDSFEDIATNEIYRYKDGMELSGDMINRVTQFQGKQKKGTIDVWWLYDDGGLTLLLPYIISTRRSWSCCKLRVFALSANNDTLEFEQRNMASLLSKFRIDYSDLTIFTGLMKKPQEETILFYENLIKDFVTKSNDQSSDEKITISEADLSTMQDKTNRHLRLRELLLEHSQDANLIVMTLPIPRKSVIPAGLYMSWLEALSQDMPPFLLVRGNQSSVLTFYT